MGWSVGVEGWGGGLGWRVGGQRLRVRGHTMMIVYGTSLLTSATVRRISPESCKVRLFPASSRPSKPNCVG